MFNPTRLSLARRRRGFTKRRLADHTGMSERAIFGFECGDISPETDTVERLATALRFPAAFFFGDDVEELTPEVASFRALTKMSAAKRNMALGAGGIALLLNNWIEKRFALPEPSLPEIRDRPETSAELVRHKWGLGEAPIKNMISLLESKGVRIYSLAIDTNDVDAFSMWHNNRPFIFLNTGKTAERCRFDCAHELGHLVMHRHGEPSGQDAERAANGFASSFLMPRASVQSYAPRNVTIKSLIAYKKYWNVSLAALNYRLHELGLVTDWTYRKLCVQISRIGRRQEPDPSQFERSQVLAKVLTALWSDGQTRYDIAQELMVSPEEIEELTFGLATRASVPDNGGPLESSKTRGLSSLRLVP
jgi:Zn-dependent peptidase ImmA (M78 family)/DNA-binding XRE family transcriptional regulator